MRNSPAAVDKSYRTMRASFVASCKSAFDASEFVVPPYMANSVPGLLRYSKQRDGRLLEYERIALPVSDDGKAVNMLMFVFAFEKEFHAVT